MHSSLCIWTCGQRFCEGSHLFIEFAAIKCTSFETMLFQSVIQEILWCFYVFLSLYYCVRRVYFDKEVKKLSFLAIDIHLDWNNWYQLLLVPSAPFRLYSEIRNWNHYWYRKQKALYTIFFACHVNLKHKLFSFEKPNFTKYIC